MQPKLPNKLLACCLSVLVSGLAVLDAQGQNSTASRAALIAAAGRADFAQVVLAQLALEKSLPAAVELLDSMIPLAVNPAAKQRLQLERVILAELAGDWESAASLLQAAAALARPGTERDNLLLRAAIAWLNAGQDSTSFALADQVLSSNQDVAVLSRAQLLRAWLYYRRNETVQAYAAVVLVLSMNVPADRLSALRLTLLVADAAAKSYWQSVYDKEFSNFPESAGSFVPYFLPVPESLKRESATLPVSTAVAANDAATLVQFFQIGVYTTGENADLAAERLQKAGFRALRSTRSQDGRTLQIVYVAAGADSAHTLIALKDAGFEAWPLTKAP
jgi:hypothetical protein